MRPLRVAIDLDGVCYEWQRTARYMLNLHRGYDLPPIDQGWWTHWGAIKDAIDPEDWQWLWSRDAVDKGLWRHGHLTKGCIEGLHRLDQEHTLLCITSRPKNAIVDTMQFLAYHRLPFTEVHIAHEVPKSSVAQWDVLVDDAPHNCEDALDAGRAAVVFDRPWNRGPTEAEIFHPQSAKFTRSFGWHDLSGCIDKVTTDGP